MYLNRYIDATFVVEKVQGGMRRAGDDEGRDGQAGRARLIRDHADLHFHLADEQGANTYRDLQPVVIVFSDAEVLYTRADGPFKTLKDVIAHAKEKRGTLGRREPRVAGTAGGGSA